MSTAGQRRPPLLAVSTAAQRPIYISVKQQGVQHETTRLMSCPGSTIDMLKTHCVPNLVIWQLEHRRFMRCFFCFKLILAIGVLCLSYFAELKVFKLGHKAGVSTRTIQLVAIAVALGIGTKGVVEWYCWTKFLMVDSHNPKINNPIPLLLDCIRENECNDVFVPACHWRKSIFFMIITICLFVFVDVQTESTVTEALWWVFAGEPLLIMFGFMSGSFVQPLGRVLEVLVYKGTKQVIKGFSARLQKRDLDWKALTKEHKQMDALLEHIWCDVYGWRIISGSVVKAVYAFLACIVVLIAKYTILKMTAFAVLVWNLYLISHRIYVCARYTEMCTKSSAGAVLGQKSIMRIASEMFGEFQGEEREAHSNFVFYLKVTQCGVELPILGLITVNKVVNFTLQIVTVVPTGLAIALAILHDKT